MFNFLQKLQIKNNFESTGIGLSACEKIINFHGGKIWAESELDKGTTIIFTLPKS